MDTSPRLVPNMSSLRLDLVMIETHFFTIWRGFYWNITLTMEVHFEDSKNFQNTKGHKSPNLILVEFIGGHHYDEATSKWEVWGTTRVSWFNGKKILHKEGL